MFDLKYSDQKKITKDLKKPFCFLDKDNLRQNITSAIKRSGHKKIRIATKSIRSLEVLEFIRQELGDKYIGLMTFHVKESLDLLKSGFNHCLMGYPQKILKDEAKLIKELAGSNKKLVLMIDSIDQCRLLQKMGSDIDHRFEVCIDIDMSLKLPRLNFGVFRSPILDVSVAEDLISYVEKAENLKCTGLMGYEAQIAGIPDYNGKGKIFDLIISKLKKTSEKRILKVRKEFLDRVKEKFQLEFFNGGGTGSIEFTASDRSVTEVTVGSGFYCPHLFDLYQKPFKPSLGYAIEVDRIPNKNYITCHGGGYIASGAIDMNKAPQIFSPKNLKINSNEMFGEVQTPLEHDGSIDIQIGDPIFLRHAKAGELLERFTNIYIIENHKVVDRWKSYRGEGKCYL